MKRLAMMMTVLLAAGVALTAEAATGTIKGIDKKKHVVMVQLQHKRSASLLKDGDHVYVKKGHTSYHGGKHYRNHRSSSGGMMGGTPGSGSNASTTGGMGGGS